jgi:mycothiol synthase
MRRVTIVPHLPANDVSRVRDLIDTAADHDGASAIGEHKFLRVSAAQQGGGCMAVLAEEGDRLVGYANAETFPIDGGCRLAAELVVRPDARRRGTGSAMVAAILERARNTYRADRVDAWAYYHLPGSRELAAKFGFHPSRTLLHIRMSLPEAFPEAALPDAVRLRAFQPGRDEAEWLALNNLVFAGHPEQGAWDLADVQARLQQPWFNPEDFLVATQAGRMIGYHWLKLDHASRKGEIYVIGVHPDQQRRHFGRALTIAGLQHMRERGMREATAYVDQENRGALAMYESLGFRADRTDLCYSKPLKDEQSG